ncbi:hypothetical protein Cgig2_024478 [Carnegiea gigantea]|uniref:Uncharacterized protein n=1 Tax=Carnegiea gigantea TaxID=171969 RepID=A0A9Q1QK72_9CARY|nr:hypothetical protein Cgig2_024478 [Carnegiea gigantea]
MESALMAEEALKVLDSSLSQIKWRLKPSSKRRLQIDVLALCSAMRPVIMVDYGGKMPELQDQLCALLELIQKISYGKVNVGGLLMKCLRFGLLEFFGNSLCGRYGAKGAVGRGMRRLSWLLDINPKVQIKTHLQPYIIPSKIILAIQAPRESSQHTTSTCTPAA